MTTELTASAPEPRKPRQPLGQIQPHDFERNPVHKMGAGPL